MLLLTGSATEGEFDSGRERESYQGQPDRHFTEPAQTYTDKRTFSAIPK